MNIAVNFAKYINIEKTVRIILMLNVITNRIIRIGNSTDTYSLNMAISNIDITETNTLADKVLNH